MGQKIQRPSMENCKRFGFWRLLSSICGASYLNKCGFHRKQYLIIKATYQPIVRHCIAQRRRNLLGDFDLRLG